MPTYLLLDTDGSSHSDLGVASHQPGAQMLDLLAESGEPERLKLGFVEGRPAGFEPAPTRAIYRPLLDLPAEVDGAGDRSVILIVGLDIEPDHEDDFNAWYDTEHLPNLARVPGVVRAHRYRQDQNGDELNSELPEYIALYDLTSSDVFGSNAWSEAVNTPWTIRLRPHFEARIRSVYRPVS